MKLREFIKDGAMKAVEADRIGSSNLIMDTLGVRERYIYWGGLEKAVIEKVRYELYCNALYLVVRKRDNVLSYRTGMTSMELDFDTLIDLITATPPPRLAAMLLALASLEGE